MKNSKASNCSRYRFEDVVVDRDNFEVCKGNQIKPLTPRAFDVLIYLIEQSGRVVEKQELFEQIWKETFVTDNALMRAIKEIRRELGDDAGAPRYIETVYKRGYRFIAELTDDEEGAKSEAEKERPESAESVRGEMAALGKPEAPVASRVRTRFISLFQEYQLVAAVALVATVIAVAAILYFRAVQTPIHSLAVLPLENANGDTNAEYMSDGITESLINSLSQLPQLKVIARTTAFRYKGQKIDPQKVGRELRVDAVLTGKVIQQGDDLIIQAELTDVEDGSQLWGERYSRKLGAIFSVQNEIAKDISEKLRLRLTGEEEKRITKRHTENTAAYESYIEGRYHLNKLAPPEIHTSISCFLKAIAIDPSYALAFVGLADAYRALALTIDMPANEFFPKSKTAAQKAMEIDNGLAEAHASLGLATLFYDWDWKEAENQFKRGLELNPNSADTHVAYAGLLSILGRHVEALNEIERARELDPLNLRTNALAGQFLILAGKDDEGLSRLEKTLELEPNFFLAHLFAANGYMKKGMYREATAEATRARDLSDGNAEAIATMAYALAMSGQHDEARKSLDELIKRSSERYVPPYNFALIHNGLGEREETFVWLQRAMEQRDPKLTFLKVDSKWNNLRDDQRFSEFVRRVGLDP